MLTMAVVERETPGTVLNRVLELPPLRTEEQQKHRLEQRRRAREAREKLVIDQAGKVRKIVKATRPGRRSDGRGSPVRREG